MIDTLLTEPQVRVIGAMIEKQFTTPSGYPMTPNAIRVACNQKNNRDPVVEYDDNTIYDLLQDLQRLGQVEIDQMEYSRTSKYRQIFGKAQALETGELVILCELFNRGPQTPGDLRARCERMHRFKDLADVERCLGQLATRQFVLMLERLPGTKEHRWDQLFCGQPKLSAPTPAPVKGDSSSKADGLEARVVYLEQQLRLMAERLAALELSQNDTQ